MDEVQKKNKTFTMTKHDALTAELVPIENEPPKLFGCMKEIISILGDIIQAIDEQWEACDNDIISNIYDNFIKK